MLLNLQYIKSLEKDNKHGVLFQFANLYSTGDINGFETFQKANAGFASSIGIDEVR